MEGPGAPEGSGPEAGEAAEQQLIAAGLYDPADPAAGERARLLRYLTSLGATLDQMEQANRSNRLSSLAGELVSRPVHERLTVAEAAARAATTPERVRRVLLAAGLTVDADDPLPLSVDDLRAVRAFEAGAGLVGDEGALAFTRLLGNAAARVAEASVELFTLHIADALDAVEGAGEEDHARASAAAIEATRSVPEVFGQLLHQHLHRAVRRSLLERLDDQPDLVHTTVGFVDLVGSTSWTRGRTNVELAKALVQFEAAAFDIAAEHGGWVVKLIGDAAMIEAPDPLSACRIGLDLCRAVEASPDLPGARGGFATGMVQARDGDYFGTVVNLASRAAGVATPSALAVNDVLAGHLREHLADPARDPDPLGPWVVGDLPPHDLHGFDEPQPLYSLYRRA